MKSQSHKTDLQRTLDRGNGDLFTREQFRENVEEGAFTDWDGGYDAFRADGSQWFPEGVDPKKDFFFGFACSELEELPEEITQIVWYNK